MDDLLAALRPFDADAILRAAPDPWDYLPMPARRSGPPWATAESIAAEPALAARIIARLVADGSAAAHARRLCIFGNERKNSQKYGGKCSKAFHVTSIPMGR